MVDTGGLGRNDSIMKLLLRFKGKIFKTIKIKMID